MESHTPPPFQLIFLSYCITIPLSRTLAFHGRGRYDGDKENWFENEGTNMGSFRFPNPVSSGMHVPYRLTPEYAPVKNGKTDPRQADVA